jgi:hypothetical protein
MTKNCLFCNKEFIFRGTKRKYCCHSCSSMASRGHKDSKETRTKRSLSLVGHPVAKRSRDKLMEYIRTYGPWNKGKLNPKISGKNHHNWRGGVTNETKRRIGLIDWILVRNSVFNRDGYRCRCCGKGCNNGKLHCHHQIPYRISKDNSLNNLISLCNKCHTITDYEFRKFEVINPYYCRPELFGHYSVTVKYGKV